MILWKYLAIAIAFVAVMVGIGVAILMTGNWDLYPVLIVAYLAGAFVLYKGLFR